jgi:ABC-type antimicrobial peptide transport system permease subunit
MNYGPEVMPEDYGDRIRSSSLGRHVKMVEPRLYGNITVQGTDLILVGQRIAIPQFGSDNENVMAVSSGAAQSLGISLNESLNIEGNSLRTVTIIDPSPKGMDMAIFVPLNVAQRILGKSGKINALHMGGCWCKLDVPAFAAEVEKILPGTMAITIDGMAKAQQEIIQVMEKYSAAVWVVGILLATGSIVFLILYTIYKGGREIGLLLSIGLSPVKIIIKNIIVSIITAISGALIGYLLSVPLMSYLGITFMKINLDLSWDLFPYFVTASLVIALMAASFPSWYVTRLDPAKLLREE